MGDFYVAYVATTAKDFQWVALGTGDSVQHECDMHRGFLGVAVSFDALRLTCSY